MNVEAPADVRVECYSGYRAEETPRRLYLGGRPTEVVEVIDRWLSTEFRYFKCRAGDGGIYLLRHDVAGERWELVLYQRDASIPDPGPHEAFPAGQP